MAPKKQQTPAQKAAFAKMQAINAAKRVAATSASNKSDTEPEANLVRTTATFNR